LLKIQRPRRFPVTEKIKVAVLMGGPSLEHSVSLNTGKNVLSNLDDDRYNQVAVVISQAGLWSIEDREPVAAEEAIGKLKTMNVDIMFLALHGTFGEDGTVQGLLESTGMAYTGSPNGASAICINKIATKALLQYYGLPVAKDLVIPFREWVNREKLPKACKKIQTINGGPGFPCVVKAPNQGSSFGVFIANSEDELIKGLKDPVFAGHPILIEQYIKGTELTCGIIEMAGGKLKVLPVTEIVPLKGKFFDYKAKYTVGATDEITPARISKELTSRIQAATKEAFIACGCRGVARIDFFAEKDKIYVIEVNTLPGLTITSLLPQEAKEAGIGFKELLSIIIESGLDRFQKEGTNK
jgi:D-alanine-D-alanine ligase